MSAVVYPASIASRSLIPPGLSVILGPDGKPLPYTPQSRVGFGAGNPVPPRVADAIEPRIFEYRPWVNTSITPRLDEGQTYSFKALRGLVEFCTYARLAINYRKNQFRALKLDFTPREGTSKAEAKDEIRAAEAFWAHPDPPGAGALGRPRYGSSLSNWIASGNEELFICDALPIYIRRDRAGRCIGLQQIDPATIKVILDDDGIPAYYQQILFGYPAADYAPEDLVYLQYNETLSSSYGSPPMEQIAQTVNVAIRRTMTQLAWYTEGNIPSACLEAPEGWTADQIASAQVYLDEQFSGNEAQRHKMRLIPHGSNYRDAKPFAFSKDEEESILTQVISAFGVPRSTFVAQVNRATAETSANDAIDSGRKPLEVWWCSFIDWVTQNVLGLTNVRAVFSGGDTQNVKDSADADVTLAGGPILTVNEIRATRGLDPLPGGDKLAGASEAKPGDTGGMNGKPDGRGAPDVSGDGAEGGGAVGQDGTRASDASGDGGGLEADAAGNQGGEPAVAVAKSAGAAQAARKELATWKRFALKPERGERGKWGAPFSARHIPVYAANALAHDLKQALTEADAREAFEFHSSEIEHALMRGLKTRADRDGIEREHLTTGEPCWCGTDTGATT